MGFSIETERTHSELELFGQESTAKMGVEKNTQPVAKNNMANKYFFTEIIINGYRSLKRGNSKSSDVGAGEFGN